MKTRKLITVILMLTVLVASWLVRPTASAASVAGSGATQWSQHG
ncbi:hypothetical protein ACFOSS_01390 [Pseudaeromonas sharmana]|uniref:Uncharacterized protein n=1 Tax=Pseudaeromonas sharmana TaxID=328412 RepID=A0ABV8CIS8_9GAMM